MYDMFIDVFQSLLAFCKDLIRHATERCFNGILKCIFRCVVGQEAASPTLGHSRFFLVQLDATRPAETFKSGAAQ